jgi:hypothetical protein
MVDKGGGEAREGAAPGIQWEPGEEDYPFPARTGESALDFLARWLATADYARVDRAGVRYIHETDVANLFNHVTADVELLRARLEQFGDQVIAAADHASTMRRIETSIAELREALAILDGSGDR